MSIVAELYRFVVGVDTHAKTHTFAVIDTRTGKEVGVRDYPVTAKGMGRAVTWALSVAGGEPLLAAVECTSTYGATITREFTARQVKVVQAIPPRRSSRRAKGKSDRIDAEAAARSVLGRSIEGLSIPKDPDGYAKAMGVLLTARDRLKTRRTADISALTALLRSCDLGVDARCALKAAQINKIANWRVDPKDLSTLMVLRVQAKTLATAIITARKDLDENKAQLMRLLLQTAPSLKGLPGVGPVNGCQILASRAQEGRIPSEAAFACLAGVAPIPASSGNTVRHRLSRYGDRQLNLALDVVAKSRIRFEPETQLYVAKRKAQGKSDREIRRLLRRYIARQIHRHLAPIGL